MKRLKGIAKRVLAIGAVSALPLVGLAAPAQAQSSLELCNSVNSVGTMLVFSDNWPGGNILVVGNCKTYGAVSSIRVDPDPEFGSMPDVDSTLVGKEGVGYYRCDPGEGLIDPPNDTGGLYIKFNSNRGSC
jgi:hypothetical protein